MSWCAESARCPAAGLFPTLCTSLVLREGDLLSPGLQPLPGPFCAGVPCSSSCKAREITSCFSTQPQPGAPSHKPSHSLNTVV